MNSFSMQIKEELGQINNLSKKEFVKQELAGYFSTFNNTTFSTESEYNINRFAKLLENAGEKNYSIGIKGKVYTIKLKKRIDIEVDLTDENCAKNYARGAFMATGTINNPQNIYHIEITFDEKENAETFENLLIDRELKFKIHNRKEKYIVYSEDGDSISSFLAFIGANKSVLKFEETRVLKNVRNRVNRMVNYETANMGKTIKSSVVQINYINKLKDSKKFDILTDKEKELANLRLKNPEASLIDLGNMLEPKIGKSGVYHRMESIINKAKSI